MNQYHAELEQMIAKREKMHADHMNKYRNGSATRAKTTTHNANVSQINERIQWLRAEIKKKA